MYVSHLPREKLLHAKGIQPHRFLLATQGRFPAITLVPVYLDRAPHQPEKWGPGVVFKDQVKGTVSTEAHAELTARDAILGFTQLALGADAPRLAPP